MPPSRLSVKSAISVEVYTIASLTLDTLAIETKAGETTTVTARMDPPPFLPLQLPLTQTKVSVANIPPSFTVGTNGVGTFDVQGSAPGVTQVTVNLPSTYGGSSTGFAVHIAAPPPPPLDTTSGPSTGGQRVTIHAAPMSGRCVAMFDGVSGWNTTTSSAGYLTTSTPPHDAGNVDVVLRCGSETATFPKTYTYTSLPSRITRISPTSGSSGGGLLVSVNGENIRRGRCLIWFDGVPATTLRNDQPADMLIATPPHAPGSVDVVMRCGSDLSTLGGAFLYTGSDSAPQVAGMNPTAAAPGEQVIVSGSGFHVDDHIFFDGVPGIDVTSTPDEHFVTVPDLVPGNAAITLHDSAGHTVPGPSFRVLAPAAPQITSAPARVVATSEFPITGAGFRRSLIFFLGGTMLQASTVASTYAQLRLPASIGPGSYPLTIAGTTAFRTIEVTDGVAVTSVSIPCSSTEGGPFVTITGNGFATGAVVSLGAADSGDVTVHDAHTIVARVPPSSGLASETITVRNPTGESGQLSNAFRYRWPDPGCGTTRHRGVTH